MSDLTELADYRKDHLAWPIPDDIFRLADQSAVIDYLTARKLRIEHSEADPLRYGYVPAVWDLLERQIKELRSKFPKGVIKLAIFGGNRSSKTRFAANFLNRQLLSKKGRRWWCCSEGSLVTTNRGQVPIERVVKGDHVLTRNGFRKVLSFWDNGERPVVEVVHERGSLFVTEDHELLTRRGWVQARHIIAGAAHTIPAIGSNIGVRRRVLVSARTELSPSSSERFSAQNVLMAGEADDVTQIDADWTPTEVIKLVALGNRSNNFLPQPYSCAGGNPITMYQSVSRPGTERPIDALICVNQEVVGGKLLFQPTLKKRVASRASNGSITGQDVSTVNAYFNGSIVHQVQHAGKRRVYDLSIEDEHEYIADGVVVHNCCDSTEAQSRANQMRLIWEQFPPEWKNLERGQLTDIRYALSDGFPKNLFVAPNGSECFFKFYTMDLENLPGPELDGIWADELIPLPWVESLIYRLANRNGIFLITFTPEFGWNETFGHFYEGAQIIEEVDAPLLPILDRHGKKVGFEQVPRVMQCQDPSARIIFFHTHDNPFGNYEAIVQEEKSKGNNKDSIRIRMYGVCTKAHKVAFPMFNKNAHVISEEQFGKIMDEHPRGVSYHLVDPCDGRNWFMGWIFCPRADWWIMYREWPSTGHRAAYIKGAGILGPWAVSGAAADGVRGPAQDSLGFSLERYKEEIEDKETNPDGQREDIFARYIDSRYATQRKTERETVTTLQEQLLEIDVDFLCMVAESRILGARDGSIDMINSALYYDAETPLGEFSADLARLNVPKFQIVETCPNTIWAMSHWSGLDGQKGACKDPIDVVRGAFLSRINFVDADMNLFTGGGIPK